MKTVKIEILAEIRDADELSENNIEGTVNDMRALVLQAIKDSGGIKLIRMQTDVEDKDE